MRKHVDEVHDENVEVGAPHVRHVGEELFGSGGVVNFVICERVVTAITLNLCAHERFLVHVFAFFFVLVNP